MSTTSSSCVPFILPAIKRHYSTCILILTSFTFFYDSIKSHHNVISSISEKLGKIHRHQVVSMSGSGILANIITLIVVALVVAMCRVACQAEAARAFFVFGDSLVDSGNNNYLVTPARADSPPYGIDLPTHRATGRFSNGLNFPDVIGEAMGLKSPLPFLSPELNGQKLLNGANFASAGIGILNETGFQFVNILNIFRQFELFQEYQQRLHKLIGPEQAQKLVNSAIVLITLGGNDFVNNYFLTPIRRQQFSPPDYCRFLVSKYKEILQMLYGLGARRVLVTGTGPLGCVPGVLALSRSRDRTCAPEPQLAAHAFNSELFEMLKTLNAEVGSDTYIGVNAFDMHMDFISNPQKFGFVSAKEACCGIGPYNGIGLCNLASNLCQNRDQFVFWDAYHPSERTLRVLVNQLMKGSVKYMKPMNLSTIMAIDAKILKL